MASEHRGDEQTPVIEDWQWADLTFVTDRLVRTAARRIRWSIARRELAALRDDLELVGIDALVRRRHIDDSRRLRRELYVALRGRAADFRRRERLLRRGDPEEIRRTVERRVPGSSEAAAGGEALEAIERCMEGVEERERRWLWRVDGDGVRVAHAAREFGVSRSRFSTLLNRAREIVRLCLRLAGFDFWRVTDSDGRSDPPARTPA